MTYLWFALGLLLGSLKIYWSTPEPVASQHKRTSESRMPLMSASFNAVGYIILGVVAFWLIMASNVNLILADGYYKFSFSADNAAEQFRADKEILMKIATRRQLQPHEQKKYQSNPGQNILQMINCQI